VTPGGRPGALAVVIAGLALAAAAVSALLAWQAWQAGVPELPELEGGATIAQSVLQLASAVLVMVWLSRGLARVRRAGAIDLSVGPWGAVLWWFVPIANLVMPAKAFAELRKAALRPADWQAVDGSPIIAVWWTFWLISGVATAAFFRAMISDDPDLQAIAGPAAFAADVFATPAALLLAVVVVAIDRQLQALSSAAGGDRPPSLVGFP
jgi:hypothetical protein